MNYIVEDFGAIRARMREITQESAGHDKERGAAQAPEAAAAEQPPEDFYSWILGGGVWADAHSGG